MCKLNANFSITGFLSNILNSREHNVLETGLFLSLGEGVDTLLGPLRERANLNQPSNSEWYTSSEPFRNSNLPFITEINKLSVLFNNLRHLNRFLIRFLKCQK